MQESKYLLIRHAHSEANRAYESVQKDSWPMKELIDAKLTDYGIKQC